MPIEAFSIERNQVSLEDDQGNSHIWSRADFPYPYWLVGIEKLSYEPRRGLYHIVLGSDPNKVIVVNDPTDAKENTLIAEIHSLAVDLEARATADSTYVPPVTLTSIREVRDSLLANCDWTQLPDAQLTTTQVQFWATYRQELRDITTQDPVVVIWPTAPI